MKLLSWNLNGRVKGAARRQLEAVLARAPDVIALQEVTTGNYADWCRGLTQAGYSVISTVDLVTLPYPPPPYPSPPFPLWKEPHDHIQRKNFNLTAARDPIALLAGLSFEDSEEARYAFPEKHLAARVTVDGAEVDVHNAHLPPGVSRGVVKVHAFEAIRRRVDEDTGNPTILCGDFNAPEFEDADGPLPSGTAARSDALRTGNTRWIEGEAGIVDSPAMRDVYRDKHDSRTPFPVSYFTGGAARRTGPRRYDYIFASSEFNTQRCEYLGDWLESGLSDHAAVEADLALPN